MNVFMLIGDIFHVMSIFILILKIYSQKSCHGISLKTQTLYVIVFVCRYLDLAWNFASLYNWVMKVIFIVTSCSVVYMMRFNKQIRETYDEKNDNFRLVFLLVPCFVLALLWNEYFSVFEVLWAFSLYLEAVAIVPQLIVVHRFAAQRNGFVETLTSHYVFALGGYRTMYLFGWIYRVLTEVGYRNYIAWVSGVVQTIIYCDFFYYYITANLEGKKMSLPI